MEFSSICLFVVLTAFTSTGYWQVAPASSLFPRSRAHHHVVGAPLFAEKPALVSSASEQRLGEIIRRSLPGPFPQIGKTDNCSTPIVPEILPSLASPASTPPTQERAPWGPRVLLHASHLLGGFRFG